MKTKVLNAEAINSISLAAYAVAEARNTPSGARLGLGKAHFWLKQAAIYAFEGEKGGSVGEKRASAIAVSPAAYANTASVTVMDAFKQFFNEINFNVFK